MMLYKKVGWFFGCKILFFLFLDDKNHIKCLKGIFLKNNFTKNSININCRDSKTRKYYLEFTLFY